MLSSILEKIPFSIMYSISRRALKQQFSKIAEAGYIKLPESSCPAPTTQENSCLSDSNRFLFKSKISPIFGRFLETFKHVFVIFRNVLKISGKIDIEAILRDIFQFTLKFKNNRFRQYLE